MWKFNGRPDKLAMEEVTSIFYATDCVLKAHGYGYEIDYVNVSFRKCIDDLTTVGQCQTATRTILLRKDNDFNVMLTTIIHEMIHLYCMWNHETEKEEYLTSTLTGKIKKDVLKIANVLMKGKYQRAAFFAHMKIAYEKQVKEDQYNDDQFKQVRIASNGIKYRNKRSGR